MQVTLEKKINNSVSIVKQIIEILFDNLIKLINLKKNS